MNQLRTKPNEPQLDPPGAGLPATELFVARLLFRFQRFTKDKAYWSDLFETEEQQILEIGNSVPETTGRTRVLIKRLQGLEDSSRFWSIYMVLDHLNIVNQSVQQTILELSDGSVPASEVSTATVKPRPDCDSTTVQQFEDTCQQFRKTVKELPTLLTTSQFAHPWFGHLNAAGWHAMAAFHMRLHRKQMQSILHDLPV